MDHRGRRGRAFVVLASPLAVLLLAACGGGDDDSNGGGQQAAASAEGSGTSTVPVAVDPEATVAYEQEALGASAGEIEFDLDNPATLAHDLRIEDAGGNDVGGTPIISDSQASVTLELEPGEYTFYCSVPGHREAGMEGPLTVE